MPFDKTLYLGFTHGFYQILYASELTFWADMLYTHAIKFPRNIHLLLLKT